MKRLAAALVAAAAWLVATSAVAHQLGISKGEYTVSERGVAAVVVLQNGELAAAVPDVDRDRDGKLSAEEVAVGRAKLVDHVLGAVTVKAGDRACVREGDEATIVESDGVELRAAFACAKPESPSVELGFVTRLSDGHRHLATLRDGDREADVVAHRGVTTLTLPARGAPAPAKTAAGFWAMAWLGVEHILTGYDHLVFLLGLVLVGGRARALVGVVTAFTVAHSITLGLAALGVLSPPSSVVEPAIAASIAYVGIENFFVKDAGKRWRITFPFGLVHGFGFAGALTEIALSRAEVPKALLAFNLGVEAGQLAVLAVLLPLLRLATKIPKWSPWGVRGVSAVIVLAGAVWFVLRVAA